MVIKTALVGIGKIARDQHIPALAANPDFDLVAAVSRNAQIDGVANYATLDKLLTDQPDVELVSLCMPPAARFEYAASAIAAGRNVMLEKPPGATLSECHELVRLAKAKGVCLFATWHSRSAAAVSEAKA
jgi:D-galactose 1-dehydrogenase